MPCNDDEGGHRKPDYVREQVGYIWARTVIMLARLIQRHHPELLADPVDVIVREELAKAYDDIGYTNTARSVRESRFPTAHEVAKRLYLLGIEKGKQS